MTLVIPQTTLPGDDEAHRFAGADHGGVPVSFFLVHSAPGAGPELHRHPYAEVFVVHAGRATFEVEGRAIAAAPGDVVIAPGGAAHRFVNAGDDELRLTAIHPVAEMRTEWLGA